MPNRHSLLLIFPMLFSAAVLYLLLSDELEPHSDSISATTESEQNFQMMDSSRPIGVPVLNRLYSRLFYAESKLRAQQTDHLTDTQRKNRAELLDHLNEYIFSESLSIRSLSELNTAENVISYLVIKTSEPEVAGIILTELSENGLSKTDHPAFLNWIEESGITKEELAMIQPLYFQHRNSGFEPPLF